ncbi:TRAP transporter small permease [Pseudomonas sp. Choline-3u-10]|jgi:TRAP-type transport system small permease protein|uniref:TRAP transporter small permease n=1 Tax=Pseudomonadaceae TaxID=135621 RepID=UPI000617E5CB|nr:MULTISPECIES: TRAP transporter small permease [Pseudomonadaceae]MBU0948538.1 TRAP transporter small permease [Gammaproteobacteria bacterium]HBM08661.1 TRAP transporter small permease [Pseudomonas sp.]KJJ64981.1 C4-dicarboxylate ABC transporter permease [Pseudomonas sp. 10B238]MBK3795840.1 TRAP transporter small permease subunit [Stutzerimonas stutzeri]MBK3877805.1 TRAP transporter small permease subunit [Stutzerimonas stutzeri]|tara:strand:- start:2327 stop:2803 length:477 start_codon:yes stop_codon:yes gene_type:complete
MNNRQDARLERVLATLALVIISVISLANVVVRYFTDASFAFTEEISVFLLVILTFAGASVAMRSNRHIRIGFAERMFPRLRTPLILLQWLASVLVLGMVLWYGGQFALEEYQWESESPGLGLPNWWYVVWLPLLALMMLIRLTQMTIDRLRGRLTDEP